MLDLPPLTRDMLEDEGALAAAFPSLAGAMALPTERRRLLTMMAASLALAGCDPAAPGSAWVPAVTAPPGIVPGVPNRYSTATLSGGAALGIVVTHQMGRPVKVEGNPLHPASLGATDALAQASILGFYDPDRASGLLRSGAPTSEGRLLGALVPLRERLAATQGAGLRILTNTVMSPTLGAALDRLLARYPGARWHQTELAPRDGVRAGAAQAYGRPVDVLPHPGAADMLLALDSDLADGAPGWVRHAREVAARRNPVLGPPNRIVAAETVPSAIGVLADQRIPATPAELHDAVAKLAAALLRHQPASGPAWLTAAAAALQAAPGRALIHAGPSLSAGDHHLVHLMNEALGARGQTVTVHEPAEHRPEDQGASLADLMREMRDGTVEALLMLDLNPVYSVPGFVEALSHVPVTLHGGPAPDETAIAANWHIPLAHPFESWGDLRAHDGTVTILQPQALPLHGGRSALAILALLDSGDPPDPRAAVRATWRDRLRDDEAWARALADGIVPGTASPALDVRPAFVTAGPGEPGAPPAPLTLLFRPDPYLLDGRHANNGWLQELPRPLTKLTWENPLLISPATARRHGLADGDMVELSAGGRSLELPAMTLPGLAAGCAVATLGYGRTSAGQVGSGAGWDLVPLTGQGGPPTLRRTGRTVRLASTDRGGGWAEHAGLLRTASLAAFRADPRVAQGDTPAGSLYRVRPPGPVAWGMTVDLNACIGCNACVTACTAENNVPVVGRENVLKQREMHWLRIDRYWDGTPDAAQAGFQPMLCMHCEEAPCETVCPVGAALHDSEGLNLQVYNRCVGTRFCSNNCPYKVRRFNFGPYAQEEKRPPVARNPDVSVRARGVMEKCTFCVQRIAQARIEHDRDGVPERVVTACQAACPTQVFSFGDLNDRDSDVAQRKQSPLDYALLPDQQTHPRVTYHARIRATDGAA